MLIRCLERMVVLVVNAGCSLLSDEPPNLGLYNALLAVYAENNFTAFCSRTFLNEVKRYGHKPNRVTYHKILRCIAMVSL